MLHEPSQALTILGKRHHGSHNTSHCCTERESQGSPEGKASSAPMCCTAKDALAGCQPDVQYQGSQIPLGSASLEGHRAPSYGATSIRSGDESRRSACPLPVQPERVKHRRSRCQVCTAPTQASRSRSGAIAALPSPAPAALCPSVAHSYSEKYPTPEGFCHGGEQPRTDRIS